MKKKVTTQKKKREKAGPDQSSWGRVPPFVCPHARVREWVRGRKKERFQSKKLEKIRPICHIYPHYTTAPSARFLRLSFLAAPRGKKKRARQEIEQSGAPSRFLSLSLRDVASSPVESHDWNSKKIIFDVANGNENGFLCFFFYDDDERQ